MNLRLLSGNDPLGGKCFSPSKISWRLTTILATLIFGGFAAQAAGPQLSLSNSVTVAEDSFTELSIGVSDTSEAIFTVVTTAKSSNPSLIGNSTLVFSGAGTNRALAIRPALHQSGTATITVIASDSQPSSTTNTFTLTVTHTNYPPIFLSTIGNLTRNENAASTNLAFSISDVETSVSNLVVTATSSNTALVSATNLVLSGTGTNRTLKLTPAANQNGTTLIEVVITDGGGATATNDFVFTVLPVNQPPTFTMSTNRFLAVENTGLVTLSNFITGVSSGPTNQSSESNYFQLKYTTNFFSQAPTLDTNGTLTFQVATNLFGTNTVTFVLFNSGSTTNGGKNSLTNTLTLDVSFVTQPPSFTLSTNLLLVNEETLAVTNVGFLTNLSAGPSNQSSMSWGFTTTTATNSTNSALFTLLPVILTNGTLIFHPAAHSYGTNLVTVVMTNSGTTNNGGVNYASNSFTVAVAQTNHAPVIVAATNYAVLENGTNLVGGTNGLMTTVNVWDYDTQASNLVLAATSSNTNLAGVTVVTNSVGSPTNNVFTLAFSPVTNANGNVTIQLVATEGSLSTTNSFRLTITPVTQPPSFTLSTNLLLVNEETLAVTNVGFLTNLSAGPSNQSSMSWGFTTTTATNSTNSALFTLLPVILTNGTLIFHPAAHSYGTNLVTVVMTNSGTTNNGGVNYASNSFTLAVAQTNHAPVIVAATNYAVLENGTNLVGGTNGLMTTVNVWDYDTQASNLVLAATSSNTNLAGVTVVTNSVGSPTNNVFTLAFSPVTNANGNVTVQLVATEGSLSTTNSFRLTITPVTQPPKFTLSTNFLLVNEETLAVTNVGFLTNLSAGPSNQSSMSWGFTTTTATNSTNSALFTLLPVILTNGTLIFHPAAHSYGTNLVTVVMTNSGTTNNGGVNYASNSFTVAVAQTNHAPVIVAATNYAVLENGTNLVGGTNGLMTTVNVWDYDTQASNLVLAATSSNTNLAGVTVVTNSVGSPTNNVFTLAFSPVTNANGNVTIQLVATEGSLSTTNSFRLTITPVTQPPSFTLSTNLLLVNEETLAVTNVGFLTNLSAGPSNQSSMSWGFTTTTATNSTNSALFTLLPVILTNGTLIFHPAAHSYGTNLVTVVMTNSGTTNNGGVNYASNSFTVAVAQTNHAPVIVAATNYAVLENGTNLVGGTNGLMTTVNVWDYDTQASNLVLAATSSNTNLAGVTVVTNSVGSPTNNVFTLAFSPVTNANGNVTIQLVATEGSLSTTNSFRLTITPVTQPPSFTLSTNLLLVNEETLAVTNVGFLTNLSAGPSNQSSMSWGFTTTTATNSTNSALFTLLPVILTNGTLIFHPAAHSYGTNLVTVVMTNSGTTNNGGVNYASNSFTLAVAQTNHAPVIVAATNYTVLENGTNLVGGTNGLMTTVNVWDYDTQASNLVLAATSSNTNLAGVTVVTNSVGSPTNNVFTLAFSPVTNANGNVTIQLVATEGSLSTTNSFRLTITPVTQPPSFAFSTNEIVSNILVVAENAGLTTNVSFLTGISVGPSNQIGETWGFKVLTATNSPTNATFAQFPTISTNGTLIFKTTTNSFGTNLLTVVMTNSGSTNNGGINTYSNSFELEVTQVQYPPAFTGITNKTILENATTNLTLAFTLYDPLTNSFTVTCVSSNTNLVVVSAGGTNTTRTVLFTPVTNVYGSTTISVTADDGTLTNSTNFTLTILPVNQAPSFNLAVASITVSQYDVEVTIPSAVTNILAGPTNESSQTVNFIVTNSSPSAFVVPPSVTSGGTLSFTPGVQGATVTVGIQAHDSGGTNNGGINVSPFQTLTIVIPPNAFQYLAGPFAGLFYDSNDMANASSGYFSLVLASNGTFTGHVLCAGDSNTFSGQFNATNSSASVTASNYALNFTVDTTGNWTESIYGTVSNTVANWNVPLLSYLVGFSANDPSPLAGEYLMAMPGFASSADGPTGDSIFSLIVSNNGLASLSGVLADNTAVSQESQISFNGYYPLYVPLYGSGTGGSLMGWLQITGALTNSVSPSSSLVWWNEPGSTALYAGGFTNQATPLAALYNSSLADLLSFSSGTVILSGGNLTSPITNVVTVSDNIVTVDPSATNGLSLTINRSTGEMSGSFVDLNGQTNSIDSVILQNSTNVVQGYFLGTNQVGGFIMYGN